MTKSGLVLVLALLPGCSTNPVTGRDQIVGIPAVQTHADIVFTLSTGAQRIVGGQLCDESCRGEHLLFAAQVERIGAELAAAARDMSPELFARIDSFRIGVDAELGTATGASAGGRIALGSGLSLLEPSDDVTAFVIAREMAHVIARHDEEDSGARIVFSALTLLLPGYTLIARFCVSTLGSGALMSTWAERQRHEADEIALALLERTGRSAARVAASLADSLKNERLPEGDWTSRYRESTGRVALLADIALRYADFGG